MPREKGVSRHFGTRVTIVYSRGTPSVYYSKEKEVQKEIIQYLNIWGGDTVDSIFTHISEQGEVCTTRSAIRNILKKLYQKNIVTKDFDENDREAIWSLQSESDDDCKSSCE